MLGVTKYFVMVSKTWLNITHHYDFYYYITFNWGKLDSLSDNILRGT